MTEQQNALKIEDEINNKLGDEQKGGALDFVSFLRENNITNSSENIGIQTYMDEAVCVIVVFGKINWYVYWSSNDVNDGDNTNVCKELIKFARSKRNKCTGKHCDNKPGITRKIFGKEYQNLCTSIMAFCCPTGDALEHVKELVKCSMREIERTK